MDVSFCAELWVYPGKAAWHFVTLPLHIGEDLRALDDGYRRGFGSIRVVVRIGESQWSTSVFPDSMSKSYMLPIKKSVRLAESLVAGESIQVNLSVQL